MGRLVARDHELDARPLPQKILGYFKQAFGGGSTVDYKRALAAARRWIRQNSSEAGVFFSDKRRDVYREVTGYFIPTLIGIGERDLAKTWADALLASLPPDGSVTSVDGKPYVFDAAQVMRGFLCFPEDPAFRDGLAQIGQHILANQRDDGSFADPYGGRIPPYIFLYALEPVREAGAALGREDFADAAAKALGYYASRFDPRDFSANAHFFGYAVEALLDLGHMDAATVAAAVAKSCIRRDGGLAAAQGAPWISSPGQGQFASIFYKLGDLETGDRLLHWLVQHQRDSGGFYGGYGRETDYLTDAEPSWAVKFFIDAILLRIRRHFELEFPAWMDTKERDNDLRFDALRNHFAGLQDARVLEIGCGCGRFLNMLRKQMPRNEYFGYDLSSTLIAMLPDGIRGSTGDMMNLPYRDADFDAVYIMDALQHAPDFRAAIGEMMRVLKPNGKFIIIDKNAELLGSVKIMPWEQWFDRGEVLECLRRYSDDVAVKGLGHGPAKDEADLYLGWMGRRK